MLTPYGMEQMRRAGGLEAYKKAWEEEWANSEEDEDEEVEA